MEVTTFIEYFDPVTRIKCFTLWNDNSSKIKIALGSSHNHQAWPGGYEEHLKQVMESALGLYHLLNDINPKSPLSFKLEDALLVLFLHDLEKPWKSEWAHVYTKQERLVWKFQKIAEYQIALTEEQINALTYIEGEGNDYNPTKRTMNELAAFCHCCDVISARIWHSTKI